MGGGRSSTTTTVELPEEIKPYAKALGEQLEIAVGKYPLDFLFQYRPMPILPPSPEEMYLRNVIMGLPFGGQLPSGMTNYQENMPYGNIFLNPDIAKGALLQIGQSISQQPIPQQFDQLLTSSSFQDWLLTQQLAEIFGAGPVGALMMPKENSPFYNAWLKGIDNILRQTGLPINDYTRNIAMQAIKLANTRRRQIGD